MLRLNIIQGIATCISTCIVTHFEAKSIPNLAFFLLKLISLLVLQKEETACVLKPDPISSGGKKYKGRSVTSEKNHTVSNLNISLF